MSIEQLSIIKHIDRNKVTAVVYYYETVYYDSSH